MGLISLSISFFYLTTNGPPTHLPSLNTGLHVSKSDPSTFSRLLPATTTNVSLPLHKLRLLDIWIITIFTSQNTVYIKWCDLFHFIHSRTPLRWHFRTGLDGIWWTLLTTFPPRRTTQPRRKKGGTTGPSESTHGKTKVENDDNLPFPQVKRKF